MICYAGTLVGHRHYLLKNCMNTLGYGKNEHQAGNVGAEIVQTPDYDIYREFRDGGQSRRAVHCESISARAQKQAWSLNAGHHYDLNQFFWVTRGGGRARIDGVTHGFGPNTALFIPDMTVHGFEFTPGSVGWVVSLKRDLPVLLPPRPVMCSVLQPTQQAYLTAEYSALNAEYTGDNADRDEALLHHAGLLSIRYRRMKSDVLRQGFSKDNARRRIMRKFIERLEERFNSDDSVRDYAGALSVTTTHLTRVCRETTGKPATKLIQDRTILEARRALAHTDARIAKIAEDLGFHNPAYFSRVFTQQTGKSPRAFRQETQKHALSNPAARQVI